jgi:hypothetical protein
MECDASSFAPGTRVYYRHAQDDQAAQCVECDRGPYSGLVVRSLLIIAAIIAGAAGLYKGVILYTERNPSRYAKYQRFWCVINAPVKCKILVGFYMIVVKLEDVYEVSLPAEVKAMLRVIRITLSLGLGSLPSVLTCVGLPGFEAYLVLWFIAPIAASICLLLTSAGYMLLRLHLDPRRPPCTALTFRSVWRLAVPLILRMLFLLVSIQWRSNPRPACSLER